MSSSPESAMWSSVIQIAMNDALKNLMQIDWFSTKHAKTIIEYAGLDPVAVRDRVRLLAIAEARIRAAAGKSKRTEKNACIREGIAFDCSDPVDDKPQKRTARKTKAEMGGTNGRF